jgi:hypothetical protein
MKFYRYLVGWIVFTLGLIQVEAQLNVTPSLSQQLTNPIVSPTNAYQGLFYDPNGNPITGGTNGGGGSTTNATISVRDIIPFGASGSYATNTLKITTNLNGFIAQLPDLGTLGFAGQTNNPYGRIMFNTGHSGDAEFQIASLNALQLGASYGADYKAVVQLGAGNGFHTLWFMDSDGSGGVDPNIPDWHTNDAPSEPLCYETVSNGVIRLVLTRAEWDTNLSDAEWTIYNPITWGVRQINTTYSPGRLQVEVRTNGMNIPLNLTVGRNVTVSTNPGSTFYSKAATNRFDGIQHMVRSLGSSSQVCLNLVNVGGGAGTAAAVAGFSYDLPPGLTSQLNGQIDFNYPGGAASYAGEINFKPNSNSSSNSPTLALTVAGTNNMSILYGAEMLMPLATKPTQVTYGGIMLWNSNNTAVYFVGTNGTILGHVP